MILTPEEQIHVREEIDYLIDIHGYEYVWGVETAMDKTRGLLRDAPAKITEGVQKLASNPTLIGINERLAAHNAELCRQEADGRENKATRGNSGKPRKPHPLSANPLHGSNFNFEDDHL